MTKTSESASVLLQSWSGEFDFYTKQFLSLLNVRSSILSLVSFLFESKTVPPSHKVRDAGTFYGKILASKVYFASVYLQWTQF